MKKIVVNEHLGDLIGLSDDVLDVSCKVDKAATILGDLMGSYNKEDSEVNLMIWSADRNRILILLDVVVDYISDARKMAEKIVKDLEDKATKLKEETKHED